jgi:molecular chaperone GrpE
MPEDLRQDERMKGLITGIEATARELDSVFQRNGVTRVESLGQPLDPHRHQAMVEIPSEEAEPGTIVQEMQAGYMLKDRLLRPALVGVAKTPD